MVSSVDFFSRRGKQFSDDRGVIMVTIPSELIAQRPLARGKSRLLVRRADGEVQHRQFQQLADLLSTGTVVVANDSRVFPARLFANHPQRFELLLVDQPCKIAEARYTSRALLRPSKKIAVGTTFNCRAGLRVEVIDRQSHGGHLLFEVQLAGIDDLPNYLLEQAHVPLPPYIKRPMLQPANCSDDYTQYQTVYADTTGSVAAPTAGLHFSQPCLDRLSNKGIEMVYLTLHVGAGTFLPIRAKNVADHQLLAEKYLIPQETFNVLYRARQERRPIVAVGTTTFRAVESFFAIDNPSTKTNCWQTTDLYLYPRQQQCYHPQMIEALLTNFHQPNSTLFLLICALIGTENASDLYRLAVRERYRFFSYGDACLLSFI